MGSCLNPPVYYSPGPPGYYNNGYHYGMNNYDRFGFSNHHPNYNMFPHSDMHHDMHHGGFGMNHGGF